MPAVTWSVLGHDRQPKLGYAALADACAPVIVVADRLPASVERGATLALDVHVVSDRRDPMLGCSIEATLAWQGGEERWRWGGDIPADACVRVGTAPIVVPVAPGPLTFTLVLDGPVHARTRTSPSSPDLVRRSTFAYPQVIVGTDNAHPNLVSPVWRWSGG
jgi:hypothetical protein